MITRLTLSLRAVLNNLTPAIVLLLSAGFSTGLTFAPCYSSLCVEAYFARQTRYHIALFYGLLASVAIFLSLRRCIGLCRRLSEHYLYVGPSPLTGGRITVGGVLLSIWICGLTFGSIGYWYPAQNEFWTARGALAEWTKHMSRVIWTGVTGHWCDIWIGLVVIPIGRNSIIVRVFRLQPSTLLTAHKVIAYGLLVFSLIHGVLYYSFIAAYVANEGTNASYQQFSPHNPLLTRHDAEEKGTFAEFVLPTGAIAGMLLIPAMAVTALPILRRTNYNMFYYFHIVAAISVMILVCLHASTNFYLLIPGLLLWLCDWIWRFMNSLGTEIEATIEHAGNDWYRIQIPVNNRPGITDTALEKSGNPTMSQPLVHYYLNFATVSKLQVHALTAANIGDAFTGPTFLFRRSLEHKTVKRTNKEWTWKLMALANDNKAQTGKVTLRSRLEGPYAPPIPELFEADHLLLIVGGTGITGAISISQWWVKTYGATHIATKSLHLIWTVRHREIANLSEVDDLVSQAEEMLNMTVTVHVSSESGRLSPEIEIDRFGESHKTSGSRFWVYVSGPAGLLQSTETACIRMRESLKSKQKCESFARVDWCIADYST